MEAACTALKARLTSSEAAAQAETTRLQKALDRATSDLAARTVCFAHTVC